MSEASHEDATVADATDRGHRALARLGRLDLQTLSRLSLSTSDLEDRSVDREVATRAAERAGLGPLMLDLRSEARDYVSRAFDQGGFLAIGVDLADSRSRASTHDRVAVMVAAEDDVIAAVADPFVSEDVRIALTTPMERLQAMRPSSDGPSQPPSAADAARRELMTERAAVAAFVVLVVGSVLLAANGSGIGLFGVAAAIGVGLVAVVARGRIWP